MKKSQKLKNQFIQDYGEGYQMFGLPKLMGRIIGLLLYSGKALSLDEITEELNVSKGPVSQITSRLRDHNLIKRIWVPGTRKDYYQAESEIFGNAFHNRMVLQKKNLLLAKKYQRLLKNEQSEETDAFKVNMNEMAEFYELMMEHYQRFYDEWMNRNNKAAQAG